MAKAVHCSYELAADRAQRRGDIVFECEGSAHLVMLASKHHDVEVPQR